MFGRHYLGGVAILALTAVVARAVEVPEGAKIEISGPIRIEVQTDAQAVPGQPPHASQRILINGQEVELPGGVGGIVGQVFINGMPAGVRGGNITIGIAPTCWLGVACTLLDDGLRAKLNLSEGQGLFVESVVPDSPAAKAGFKAGDVLLKAADKSLQKIQDLIDVIQRSGGKQVVFELLRDGQQENITATPELRLGGSTMAMPAGADWERIRKWVEEMQGGAGGKAGHGMTLRLLRPGVILRAFQEPPLPDDMTITITKTGKEPAKVTVKQGDQNWETTTKELDKLPEKVRAYVEHMLAMGGRENVSVNEASNVSVIERNIVPQTGAVVTGGVGMVAPPQPSADGRLEQRLHELDQRMEKLGRLIEDLKQHQPPPGVFAPEPSVFEPNKKPAKESPPKQDKPAKEKTQEKPVKEL